MFGRWRRRDMPAALEGSCRLWSFNECMEDELARARELVDVLRQGLLVSISVAELGVREKTPYNLLSVRESLIWQTEELARAACEMLERGDLAAGMLLTRAITESAAFIFWLQELLETRSQRSASES